MGIERLEVYPASRSMPLKKRLIPGFVDRRERRRLTRQAAG
jgi:hypothetical protein